MKKAVSSLLFLVYFFIGSTAQATVENDSLAAVWSDEQQPNTARFQAIHDLIWRNYMQTNIDSGIVLGELYLEFAESKDSKKATADALLTLGRLYLRKGSTTQSNLFTNRSLTLATEIVDSITIGGCYSVLGMNGGNTGEFEYDYSYRTLLLALSINTKTGNTQFEAYDYGNLGNLFASLGMMEEAKEYYTKMQDIAAQEDYQLILAATTSNLGIVYLSLGDTATAIEYKIKGLQLSVEGGFLAYQGNNLEDLLRIHIARNEMELAEKYLAHLKVVADKLQNPYYFASYESYKGVIALKQRNYKQAVSSCMKGYQLAVESLFNENKRIACKCLYEAYKSSGKEREALKYFELLDALKNNDQKDKMRTEILRKEFERQLVSDSLAQVEKERSVIEVHNEEMRAEEKTRNIGFGIGGLVLLLAGGLYSRLRFVRKSKAIVEKEKDRSNNLLLNILPADIAEELKIHGRAEARNFDMVSILFTDFKGFTRASAKLSAQELVSEINTCFEAFDGIMEKYGIEKIKTIGDAYMAAGGLPVPADDSVKNTVMAALEMQAFIDKRKTAMDTAGKPAFEMRVGIHTGPVVAGIVGVKKFQYDVWGDTVNTAARMESDGEIGKVNISQSTYELLKNDPMFSFESRGKITVKGKGEIDMWFVNNS